MSMRARGSISAIAVLSIVAFTGCAQLLPKARAEVSSPWRTFEAAREAIDRIEPYRTTIADLRAAGIDPYEDSNVQVLTFSDVMLRCERIGDFWLDALSFRRVVEVTGWSFN